MTDGNAERNGTLRWMSVVRRGDRSQRARRHPEQDSGRVNREPRLPKATLVRLLRQRLDPVAFSVSLREDP